MNNKLIAILSSNDYLPSASDLFLERFLNIFRFIIRLGIVISFFIVIISFLYGLIIVMSSKKTEKKSKGKAKIIFAVKYLFIASLIIGIIGIIESAVLNCRYPVGLMCPIYIPLIMSF